MKQIELEQTSGVLLPLLSHLRSCYLRGELLAVREAAAGIVVTLDRAGVRPEREELEPVVVRDKIAGLSRKLAQQEESAAQLSAENSALRREIAELRKVKATVELMNEGATANEAPLEMTTRIREALLAMKRNLATHEDETSRRTLRAVEALIKRVEEFLKK